MRHHTTDKVICYVNVLVALINSLTCREFSCTLTVPKNRKLMSTTANFSHQQPAKPNYFFAESTQADVLCFTSLSGDNTLSTRTPAKCSESHYEYISIS